MSETRAPRSDKGKPRARKAATIGEALSACLDAINALGDADQQKALRALCAVFDGKWVSHLGK